MIFEFEEIFCDYDSTVNNMDKWLLWINKTFHTSFVSDDVTHWEWYADIAESMNIDVFGYFKENIAYNSKEALSSVPFTGAKVFFDTLVSIAKTYILTATHDPDIIKIKDIHFENHFESPSCCVIHEYDKSKYAVSLLTGKPNVLIDDKVQNCVDWVRCGGIAFLYNHNNTYVYAQTTFEHERFFKVSTYAEIIEKLSITATPQTPLSV